MKKIISVIISIIALTVMAPGHAIEVETQPSVVEQVATQAHDKLDSLVQTLTTPFIKFSNASKQDFDCLAKNIFYEAANEPEEGKVAVGMVTLNRASDSRFPSSICGVVNQKTVFEKTRVITKEVKTVWSTKQEQKTVLEKIAVCQFSWRCIFVKTPKPSDERWEESQRVARALLDGDYADYRVKYQDAMYFHAVAIRPSWAQQKRRVSRIGGHVIYADK
jgi:spore germination cell wall hydrolase CwlJ-like protein